MKRKHSITIENCHEYYGLIYYLLRRRHRGVSNNDYMDIAHEVFSYVIDKGEPVNTKYLGLILRKVVFYYQRRMYSARSLVALEHTHAYVDKLNELDEYIELLPEHLKPIFELYRHGHSEKEIANETGYTVRHVRRLKSQLVEIINELL